MEENKKGEEPTWKPEFAESRAAALETTFSGSRVSEAYPDVSNECIWCGEPNADSLHDIYLCPHLFESEDNDILETNDLVEEAIANSHLNPCLWHRGVSTVDLPSSLRKQWGLLNHLPLVMNLIHHW